MSTDAGILLVRVCAGRRGQPPRLPGETATLERERLRQRSSRYSGRRRHSSCFCLHLSGEGSCRTYLLIDENQASFSGFVIAPSRPIRDVCIPCRGERSRRANFQKSGLSACGTAEVFPGYHRRFSAQTSSSRSSRARRNVTVADQGIVKVPSSSTVTLICSPLPL